MIQKTMLTDNQTNTVYLSDLLPSVCPNLNRHLVDALAARHIPFAYLSGTKDIWCRDYMPIQTEEKLWLAYEYTPDYLQDPQGLRRQTDWRQVGIVNLKMNAKQTGLVLDGGNVVKCGDSIVMTDKVLKENGSSPAKVEEALQEAFQCEIVFLPWDHSEYLGHSDGIVHYVGDGKVLMTNYEDFSPYYARRYRKALEKRFEVIPLHYKTKRKHKRSWAYVNFLQVGRLVLVPQLGVEEDEQALQQISDAMPSCEVVGIPSLESVRRGGGLNCISWNVFS